jgi:hypothetical protein
MRARRGDEERTVRSLTTKAGASGGRPKALLWLVLLVPVLGLAVAACDDGGVDIGGEVLNVCNIVTKEDAFGVLQEPLAEPENAPEGGFQTCTYHLEAQDRWGLVIVRARRVDLEVFQEDVRIYAESKQVQPIAVPGIGDEAFWVSQVLWFHANGIEMGIQVDFELAVPEDIDAILEASKTLAVSAVGRIREAG